MAKPQTRDMPPLSRRAAFTPSTFDAERRTVQLTWTTGARVLRGFFEPFYEELSLDPKHVRMDRLQNGAPLLDSHRAGTIGDVIGVVERAQLERGSGTATVRFDRGPAGEEAMRKVADGIVRNVSVGYRVHKMQKVEETDDGTPVYRAVDWTPHELTLAPIGADAGATVRSADTSKNPCHFIEERTMDDDTETETIDTDPSNGERTHADPIAADRERSAAIARAARTLGQSLAPADRAELEQLGDQMIRDGVSLARAKARLIDERAERGHIGFDRRDPRIEAGHQGNQHRIALMSEALAARCGGPAPSDEARQYVRLSVVDFARHFLEARGVSTRMMSKSAIIERSISGGATTSDFTHLLTETGNRLLRTAYALYQGGLKRVCRGPVPAPDFRPLQRLMLGEAAPLQQINEHGEFTRDNKMAETKEAYTLATYGKIFAITRAALINDDLGAFGMMSTKMGQQAQEFVNAQLAALLVSNPTLATDSTAVFHANHGNLAASGSVISTTSLGAAFAAMRLQKGVDKATPIDVQPKYLVVPAALESVALQNITAITPVQVSNVNPYSGKLELVVDPRLDASSATAWYVTAGPDIIDGIEFAFLDGFSPDGLGGPGPTLQMREGFDIDGVEFKVRLDFGAGFLDYRGWYKNPGA